MLDAIIVGQGIAGSVFALLCKQLELNVMVIDDHHAHSSTKIAAGIMNPLVGPRLTPLWKHRYSYHGVVDHYKAIEEIIQVPFLRQHRLIRFLSSQWELSSFQKRQGEAWATQWMRPTNEWSEMCDSGIKQFESYPVFQMNTPIFLDGVKAYLIKHNMLCQASLNYNDVNIKSSAVHWRDLSAKYMVFCEGAKAIENPFFKELKFKNAMGHMVKFESNHLPPNVILNHGKWACPMSHGCYTYGASTYWQSNVDNKKASEDSILKSLHHFLKVPYSVNAVIHGVRPCLIHHQPVAMVSGNSPRLACINGLRGQGIFFAPIMAQLLCSKLRLNKTMKPVLPQMFEYDPLKELKHEGRYPNTHHTQV